jgi:hypothetical protein
MPQLSARHNGQLPRRAVLIAAILILITHHSSLITAQDVPLFGQPTADFYGARGGGGKPVKVEWSLDRFTVPEDGVIVATLTVTGATNPQQIVRPDLKKLPPFQDRFTITDNPDPTPGPDAKEVRFSYQLRPRSRSVDRVPTLDFKWYNPAGGEGKKFPTARAEFAEITVTEPPPKPEPPAIPLDEPERLFAITTGPVVLAPAPFAPGSWTWLVFALAPPLLAGLWYVAWRLVFPDAARLAHLRRSWAARRAVDAIRKAGRTADPPAAMAVAVLGYLRARFPLPPGTATPPEVGAAMAELGAPAEDCAAVASFLRECDAARFAPAGDNGVSLAADAEALVSRLEAA